MSQLLPIGKHQFGLLAGICRLQEITITADHRAVLHINQQIVSIAHITRNGRGLSMNLHHGGLINDNRNVARINQRLFDGCFSRNNINNQAHNGIPDKWRISLASPFI